LAFFGHYRLDEIDRELCLDFKAHKLREATELREAIDAGADIRDRLGRPARPLGAASLRKLIDGLAAILDEAVEDGYIDHNPARGKRMRVHVPKPKRTFLEMDELACLLDPAADQHVPIPAGMPADLGRTAAMVAGLASRGLRPGQIATRLGIVRSTVSFHLRKAGTEVGRGYVGRRVVCEILGRSGVRASELCDLRIGHVRLHDPAGARFRIPASKTETGVREVQMSSDLVEAVVAHLDRLRRIGAPAGPEAYLGPNLRGRRMSRQRVRQIVVEAAKLASECLTAKGLRPLPRTTPHTLRRTYISIALLANNFDVKWVMGQVGHADSKMTMDVYAQLEQRIDRRHGTSFDRLIRRARDAVAGLPRSDQTSFGTRLGHEIPPGRLGGDGQSGDDAGKALQSADREMARGGIEPPTPRFSVVCSTN
jgi:DNA-binding CsgD family transcriptional regulator